MRHSGMSSWKDCLDLSIFSSMMEAIQLSNKSPPSIRLSLMLRREGSTCVRTCTPATGMSNRFMGLTKRRTLLLRWWARIWWMMWMGGTYRITTNSRSAVKGLRQIWSSSTNRSSSSSFITSKALHTRHQTSLKTLPPSSSYLYFLSSFRIPPSPSGLWPSMTLWYLYTRKKPRHWQRSKQEIILFPLCTSTSDTSVTSTSTHYCWLT